MKAINIENLCKRYPAFELKNVSFSVEEGRISGLIGRNGAGKSTTLKSMVNLISSEGKIEYFGKSVREYEREVKQRIGYVGSGNVYYPLKSAASVAKITSRFYDEWNDGIFEKYTEMFDLNLDKKISEFSEGMKVKFLIACALSHNAGILIMDEPTSGLDPLSREELCDILLELVRQNGISILFSTHITSDLTRIADDIVYLSSGEVLLDGKLEDISNAYRTVNFKDETEAKNCGCHCIGLKAVKDGYEGLVKCDSLPDVGNISNADLDSIMIHIETEKKQQRGE